MRCKCGKHQVDRHWLDGKTGPGGNEPNCDVWSYAGYVRSRGLHVEFLKHLHGEGKIGSQKNLTGDRALFRFLLRRADGVQENIRINEGCHGDRVHRALPDEKLRSVQP